jgi:multidrug efflux pump subunit AcrB
LIPLAAGIALFAWAANRDQGLTPLTLEVFASYPGADARVVADTVAAPIEQQVNGVEGMVALSSVSGQGTYSLTVAFKPGTDLNVAQVLVQNRVALALPILPDVVKRHDVSVKKKSPGVLLLVNLFSQDGRYDDLFLANYATHELRGELARLGGVGDVSLLGPQDSGVRLWIDPDKLASFNLTATGVVKALRDENVQLAPGPETPIVVRGLGRLTGPEELGDLVLKRLDGGRVVRLKDVVRFEASAGSFHFCTLDGRPSVALAVHLLPGAKARDTSRGIADKLRELKKRFPQGLEYFIVYDTSVPDLDGSLLQVHVQLPDGASLERTRETMRRLETIILRTPGVAHAVAVSGRSLLLAADAPNFGGAYVVLRAAQERKQPELAAPAIAARLRERFEKEVPEAVVNVRGLPGEFAIAIEDRGDAGPRELQDVANRIVASGNQIPQLQGLYTPYRANVPQLRLAIDRVQCREMGVTVRDILEALQMGAVAENVNQFGRQVRFMVPSDAVMRGQREQFKRLEVRSSTGRMVPLASLASITDVNGPPHVTRYNMYPAAVVYGLPAPGVRPEQVVKVVEELVKKELPNAMSSEWIQRPSRSVP